MPSKFYENVSKKRHGPFPPNETTTGANSAAVASFRIENWPLRKLRIGRWHTWGAWAGKWGDNSTSILPTSPLKTKHLKCFGRYSTKTSNRRESFKLLNNVWNYLGVPQSVWRHFSPHETIAGANLVQKLASLIPPAPRNYGAPFGRGFFAPFLDVEWCISRAGVAVGVAQDATPLFYFRNFT